MATTYISKSTGKTLVVDTVEDLHDLFNPRVEFDNLGTMVCGHRRYSLGDIQLNSKEEFDVYIKDKNNIMLPLYLYDHGGITISTTPFSCPWDSGQVGFILASKEKVRACYGTSRVTKKVQETVLEGLKREVLIYDKYLTGEVFYFKVLDAGGGEVDECSGFYGSDHVASGLIGETGIDDWELVS